MAGGGGLSDPEVTGQAAERDTAVRKLGWLTPVYSLAGDTSREIRCRARGPAAERRRAPPPQVAPGEL